MTHTPVADALSTHLPAVLRWAGAVARRMQRFHVSVDGKSSGSPNTDALTLADLTLQELIVSALRDCDPVFGNCRIEAEEETGDLGRFATHSEHVIAIDPIDGTIQYRDRTGNGWAVMLHLRTLQTVHYSLVFIPSKGEHGWWVEVAADRIACGPDDPSLPARAVLDSLPAVKPETRPASKNIYLIGFLEHDQQTADAVTGTGLRGFTSSEMPGSIYDLLARGEFGGSIIHSPNVYDFPVSLQIARALGGDALWVHNRQPVHFGELWLDEKADMLRLPGIVACSDNRQTLETLCNLAADWNPVRYAE